MEGRRIRLIEQICRLPDAHLAEVERVLASFATQASLVPSDPTPNDWPHAPLHRLSEQGTYMVTASTLHKQHFFRNATRLTMVEKHVFAMALQYAVQLEAWAFFSNHYHLIVHTSAQESSLADFCAHLHVATAKEINQLDKEPGRQVWANYWDTRLTFEKSYRARLNYVLQNPVKHGLVRVARDYPWCSAAWFERQSNPAQVKTIYSFKTDRVNVNDDFEPILEA